MPIPRRTSAPAILAAVLLALAGLIPAAAAAKPDPQRQVAGSLVQLPGQRGCLVDRAAKRGSCAAGRALAGAGAFMGSRAIAVSPDGRNVYVAATESDAVAIFTRNRRTGALSQAKGSGGCVAAAGAEGCATAIGLDEPNSLAISPNGLDLYVTSRAASSVTTFFRNPRTGALIQLPGAAGCLSGLPIPGCGSARALVGPDVVVASRDGADVYVGSFFGNAVAAGLAIGAPEGMAISADGTLLYVANAATGALAILNRDPASGALSQASGSGCITEAPLGGCTSGEQLAGANAVASFGTSVYVTSLLSSSVTAFRRSGATVGQLPGPSGCVVFAKAVGCGLGRALAAPEGVVVAPDGGNVYAAAYGSGAIAALARDRRTGTIRQLPNAAGCVSGTAPGCARGRALKGVSSLALSPDGRFLYATANRSDAVDVFRRLTR